MFANNFRDRKSNAIFGRWKAKFCRKFPRWRPQFANFVNWSANTTRRPASTGIFFAGTQRFWSTFAHSQKRDYCLKSSLRKFDLQTSIPPLISIFYAKETFRSRLFVQNFLSHSTEKFRWGTLRCIRKFWVAKNFMHQKGGYQVSSAKTFCHTVPKNFAREHFGVSENFVHRKILCIRRGYH